MDLVWCGYVFAPAGFDDELRNFLAAVHAHSPRIRQTLIPLNRESASFRLERPMRCLVRRLMKTRWRENAVFLYHLYMANIASLAEENKYFSHPAGSGNILRTTFEPDRLLPSWVDYLNGYEEIWVPSEFNRASFSAS